MEHQGTKNITWHKNNSSVLKYTKKGKRPEKRQQLSKNYVITLEVMTQAFLLATHILYFTLLILDKVWPCFLGSMYTERLYILTLLQSSFIILFAHKAQCFQNVSDFLGTYGIYIIWWTKWEEGTKLSWPIPFKTHTIHHCIWKGTYTCIYAPRTLDSIVQEGLMLKGLSQPVAKSTSTYIAYSCLPIT